MIRVNELVRRRGNEEVLRKLSLEVKDGEFIEIRGQSGSGKSTLLHILAGLDEDFVGSVTVAGRELRGASERATTMLRLRAVGLLAQAPHLVPELTVRENIFLPRFFGALIDEGMPESLLQALGLGGFLHRRVQELSGGERRRVALARALAHRPTLLLCDEPTNSLDADSAERVWNFLQALHRDGLTVLVMTHDDRLGVRASRRLTLTNGVLS